MSTTHPTRPKEQPVDEETRRILKERDATFERDKETSVDAKEAIADMRRQLKHPDLR